MSILRFLIFYIIVGLPFSYAQRPLVDKSLFKLDGFYADIISKIAYKVFSSHEKRPKSQIKINLLRGESYYTQEGDFRNQYSLSISHNILAQLENEDELAAYINLILNIKSLKRPSKRSLISNYNILQNSGHNPLAYIQLIVKLKNIISEDDQDLKEIIDLYSNNFLVQAEKLFIDLNTKNHVPKTFTKFSDKFSFFQQHQLLIDKWSSQLNLPKKVYVNFEKSRDKNYHFLIHSFYANILNINIEIPDNFKDIFVNVDELSAFIGLSLSWVKESNLRSKDLKFMKDFDKKMLNNIIALNYNPGFYSHLLENFNRFTTVAKSFPMIMQDQWENLGIDSSARIVQIDHELSKLEPIHFDLFNQTTSFQNTPHQSFLGNLFFSKNKKNQFKKSLADAQLDIWELEEETIEEAAAEKEVKTENPPINKLASEPMPKNDDPLKKVSHKISFSIPIQKIFLPKRKISKSAVSVINRHPSQSSDSENEEDKDYSEKIFDRILEVSLRRLPLILKERKIKDMVRNDQSLMALEINKMIPLAQSSQEIKWLPNLLSKLSLEKDQSTKNINDLLQVFQGDELSNNDIILDHISSIQDLEEFTLLYKQLAKKKYRHNQKNVCTFLIKNLGRSFSQAHHYDVDVKTLKEIEFCFELDKFNKLDIVEILSFNMIEKMIEKNKFKDITELEIFTKRITLDSKFYNKSLILLSELLYLKHAENEESIQVSDMIVSKNSRYTMTKSARTLIIENLPLYIKKFTYNDPKNLTPLIDWIRSPINSSGKFLSLNKVIDSTHLSANKQSLDLQAIIYYKDPQSFHQFLDDHKVHNISSAFGLLKSHSISLSNEWINDQISQHKDFDPPTLEEIDNLEGVTDKLLYYTQVLDQTDDLDEIINIKDKILKEISHIIRLSPIALELFHKNIQKIFDAILQNSPQKLISFIKDFEVFFSDSFLISKSFTPNDMLERIIQNFDDQTNINTMLLIDWIKINFYKLNEAKLRSDLLKVSQLIAKKTPISTNFKELQEKLERFDYQPYIKNDDYVLNKLKNLIQSNLISIYLDQQNLSKEEFLLITSQANQSSHYYQSANEKAFLHALKHKLKNNSDREDYYSNRLSLIWGTSNTESQFKKLLNKVPLKNFTDLQSIIEKSENVIKDLSPNSKGLPPWMIEMILSHNSSIQYPLDRLSNDFDKLKVTQAITSVLNNTSKTIVDFDHFKEILKLYNTLPTSIDIDINVNTHFIKLLDRFIPEIIAQDSQILSDSPFIKNLRTYKEISQLFYKHHKFFKLPYSSSTYSFLKKLNYPNLTKNATQLINLTSIQHLYNLKVKVLNNPHYQNLISQGIMNKIPQTSEDYLVYHTQHVINSASTFSCPQSTTYMQKYAQTVDLSIPEHVNNISHFYTLFKNTCDVFPAITVQKALRSNPTFLIERDLELELGMLKISDKKNFSYLTLPLFQDIFQHLEVNNFNDLKKIIFDDNILPFQFTHKVIELTAEVKKFKTFQEINDFFDDSKNALNIKIPFTKQLYTYIPDSEFFTPSFKVHYNNVRVSGMIELNKKITRIDPQYTELSDIVSTITRDETTRDETKKMVLRSKILTERLLTEHPHLFIENLIDKSLGLEKSKEVKNLLISQETIPLVNLFTFYQKTNQNKKGLSPRELERAISARNLTSLEKLIDSLYSTPLTNPIYNMKQLDIMLNYLDPTEHHFDNYIKNLGRINILSKFSIYFNFFNFLSAKLAWPQDQQQLVNIYKQLKGLDYQNTIKSLATNPKIDILRSILYEDHHLFIEKLVNYSFPKDAPFLNPLANKILTILKEIPQLPPGLIWAFAHRFKDYLPTKDIILTNIRERNISNFQEIPREIDHASSYFSLDSHYSHYSHYSQKFSLDAGVQKEILQNMQASTFTTENMHQYIALDEVWTRNDGGRSIVQDNSPKTNKVTLFEQKILGSKNQKMIDTYLKSKVRWKEEPILIYDLENSEKMQKIFIDKMHEAGIWPSDKKVQNDILTNLARRGPSEMTDDMLYQLYTDPSFDCSECIYNAVLKRSFWDLQRREDLFKRYLDLTENTEGPEDPVENHQNPIEKAVGRIALINVFFPEDSLQRSQTLENLANDIEADQELTAMIHSEKVRSSEEESEIGMHVLNNLLGLYQKPEERLALTKFFAINAPLPPAMADKIRQQIGINRLRGQFLYLPANAKAIALATLIKAGVMNVPEKRKELEDLLFSTVSGEDKNRAKLLYHAFAHAFRKLSPYKEGFFLGFLLGQMADKKESHTGEKIKFMLESLGGTGVSLGQKIVQKKLLPDEYLTYLEDMTDQSTIPDRHSIYNRISALLGVEDVDSVLTVEKTLGGASTSMVLQVRLKNGQRRALKILFENFVNNTRIETKIMDEALAYLVAHGGNEYKRLRPVVQEVLLGLRGQSDLRNEARHLPKMQSLYESQQLDQVTWSVIAADENPKDGILHHQSAEHIMMDLAHGKTLTRLSESEKTAIMPEIFRKEMGILLAEPDSQGYIYFEKDRHMGNYMVDSNFGHPTVYIYDYPLFSRISQDDRNALFKLIGYIEKRHSVQYNPIKKVYIDNLIAKHLAKDIAKVPVPVGKIQSHVSKAFGKKGHTTIDHLLSLLSLLSEIDGDYEARPSLVPYTVALGHAQKYSEYVPPEQTTKTFHYLLKNAILKSFGQEMVEALSNETEYEPSVCKNEDL